MFEDRLLLWRFRQGNKDAFCRIYEKYFQDLVTLAMNLLRNGAAAEDVVQDVFVSFVQSAPTFRLTGSLKGYLAVCVSNRARDWMRSRQRQGAARLPEPEILAAGDPDPVRLVVNTEEHLRLQQAMDRLPYEQREVIVLRVHGGLTFRQIAKVQDVTTQTVQSRYRYGLEKLRNSVMREANRED